MTENREQLEQAIETMATWRQQKLAEFYRQVAALPVNELSPEPVVARAVKSNRRGRTGTEKPIEQA